MLPATSKKAAIALLPMLALAGCASAAPVIGGDPGLKVVHLSALPVPPQMAVAPGERPYVVEAGDALIVDVYGLESLTKREVQVDTAGWISLPLAGNVEVGGKPIGAIETVIATKLRENFVKNPRVTINISDTAKRFVAVEGQVRTPGLYPVTGSTTLLQAIALAQGTDEFSKLDDVVIFRTVEGQRYAGLYDLKAIRHGAYPDPDVFAHDIITVGDSKARRLFKDLLQVVPLVTTPLIVAVRP